MKIDHPGAHLDHMLRQTRMNHLQLSSMADLKANMLLTMASVLAGLTAPHITQEHLKWPVLILLTFCLVTILLAAISAMPRVRNRRGGAQPDPKSSGFNILFFGDFSQLDFKKFEGAMEELMNDPSQTYEAQVRDIYLLGKYLADRKYRLLRLAYIAFISGLVISGGLLVFSGAVVF
ncbi:MAG TPA: Pycsar system effector family protein [Verrucomicrobiae bacterium]|jgi:hypothetical protein